MRKPLLLKPLLLLLLTLAVAPSALSAERLRVFASVIPIQTFIQKVGGEHVDARAMVRPGFNPHTYNPTPQQIAALSGAALYVRTGVPFEKAWMRRIQSANRRMPVIDAREGIPLLEMEAHGEGKQSHGHGRRDKHSHGHDHGSKDPHVWTSPPLVRHMVGVIRDKLIELAPEHAAAFVGNHDAFVAELNRLDRDLRVLLDPLPNRRFLVFHPAWGYFADTYGLTQVSIEREGKEPGPRALVALISQARANNIKVIFVQPQFDKRSATQVAAAIGGAVVAVDPLAADYVDNLRRVGLEFAQALEP